jgi:hypothetical protein
MPNINDYLRLAEMRGWTFMGFIDNDFYWMCANMHEFSMDIKDVKNKQMCPLCNEGLDKRKEINLLKGILGKYRKGCE